MSITIYDLPQDCWNEIFSHLPKRSYPAIGCVSKQFPKVIQFLSQKEKKILETFIKFVQNYEPSFNPAPINFSATNLFELNIQIRASESKIAKSLSDKHLTSLEQTCKSKNYYYDISGICFLATLNQKNIIYHQDLEFLIKYGYLEDAIILGKSLLLPTDELNALARKSGGQLMALIDPSRSIPVRHLNQIKNAIAISMLRADKIEEFMTRFPIDKATQPELALAYAKRGDFENSLIIYDSIAVEPYYKMNSLTSIGISCAQAGCLTVLKQVNERAHKAWELKIPTLGWWVRDSEPGPWPSDYNINEIYQALDFEQVTTKELNLFLEDAYFNPFLFEALTKLNDDEMIERYFNECSVEEKATAFTVLLNNGKLLPLAKKLNQTFHGSNWGKIIITAEYLYGIRSELALFEEELLKEENYHLIKELAFMYILKGEHQKSNSLLKKVGIEAQKERYYEFLTSPLMNGKIEKTIPLYHYLKGFKSPIFYKLGLAYAKNGFIDLAIEIADSMNGERYYNLLQEIRLNK